METDVLIVGGGTGGIAAALGAAGMGVRVVLTEETEWLGGMLTAAGVSAVDGNHHLPSGIWGEFRRELIKHYGSIESLATGWVSHTQFEPHIGNRIFHQMASGYGNLRIMKGYIPVGIEIENNRIRAIRFTHPQYRDLRIRTSITIDATEFGDIMAMAGCRYSLGRESRADSGEPWAPERADRITQDMTWVAILKDYGTKRRFEYPRPADYDESLYRGCCRECFPIEGETGVDAQTMLNYGRLPNHKYMINWPTHGNDYYADLIELSSDERRKHFLKARSVTQGWLHFIQHHLGWTHLGLADDEFPTPDRLALIPYIRESRRVRGQVRVTLPDLLDPYCSRPDPLYRQAIAVGDYPVDHHHQRVSLPEPEEYPPIPSFSIPYGALIPEQIEGLICAEKNISVSHIVNGASRLQPVVLQMGQAAGIAAGIASIQACQPSQVPIRLLQQHLLNADCWLMPFFDTQPDDPYFHAIQTCGLRGILRGQGEPYQWANRTWFYPEQTVTPEELLQTTLVIRDRKIQADPVTDQSVPPATLGRAYSILQKILVDPGCDIRQYDFQSERSNHEDRDWIIQRGAMPPEALHQAQDTPLRRKDLAWMVDKLVPFA